MDYLGVQSNSFFKTANSIGSKTKEFYESNNLVAKVAFLLLVLLFFLVLIRLLSSVGNYLMEQNGSPHLMDGMIDGKQFSVYEVDPSIKGSIPILRSVNENEGIEFTWSIWLYVDDLDYKKGEFKHVFHKGNEEFQTSGPMKGLNYPNNAPGLYFTETGNNMVLIMNSYQNIDERIKIENIPMNKWYNIITRVQGNNVDVYMNGIIANRHVMKSVVRQNYEKVYVSMNGGFSGFTSNLWYYDYALCSSDIHSLVKKGPNMKLLTTNNMMHGVPDYDSLRWFYTNADATNIGFGGI